MVAKKPLFTVEMYKKIDSDKKNVGTQSNNDLNDSIAEVASEFIKSSLNRWTSLDFNKSDEKRKMS